MTWQAYNIFVQYNEGALAAIKNELGTRELVYHVRNLDGYEWFDPQVKHGLPETGLLIVKLPSPDWGIEPEFFTETPIYPEEQSIIPRRSMPRGENLLLGTPLNEESLPPDRMAMFLMHLSRTTNASVVLYHALYWGGDLETEYALAFTPEQRTFLPGPKESECVRVFELSKPMTEVEGDVLINSLRHVGIQLPTRYFALHTREFEWERHKV